MTQPTFRDVELLSTYLDGQLSPADATRLEARLKNEAELRGVLNDLRQSRATLRSLPMRRAPRNFTLTPKMAGIRPPLPRVFPVFRFASALAAVLFFFSFAANMSVPALSAIRAAAPAPVFGMGGGGGGSDDPAAMEAAPQAEAPAAPAATMSTDNLGMPTATPELRVAVEPTQVAADVPPVVEPGASAKVDPHAAGQAAPAVVPQVPAQLPVSPVLQLGLLGLAVLSGGLAYFVQARSEHSWFKSRALQPRSMSGRQVALLVLAAVLIAALILSILWLASTTFYMPVANVFPSGPGAGGDKGPVSSGDKGGGAPVGPQSFTLTPGMGYNFSVADETGLIRAFDFPADAFQGEMLVSYISGLAGTSPETRFFERYAFSLVPADKNAELLTPYTISLDYAEDVAAEVDENGLVLYWWSGDGGWQDATGTCGAASVYAREPDVNRLSVVVCKMGNFVLTAP